MDELENCFLEISTLIDTHRKNAFRKVNEELVMMYYEIGSYLFKKINNEKWGSKTIERIADNMAYFYPELKGFNRSGLYRMVQFYQTYMDSEIVAPLVRQISWSNNILILIS